MLANTEVWRSDESKCLRAQHRVPQVSRMFTVMARESEQQRRLAHMGVVLVPPAQLQKVEQLKE